ncbi:hypothetical protein KR054_011016, partial [Drosophila jambulina]
KDNNFLVVRPSYTIRHKYPGPLITYDGEERCEPRLIRLSDLKSSQVDMLMSMCEEQEVELLKCEPAEREGSDGTCTDSRNGTPEETDEELCCAEREEDLKKFESQIFINLLPQQKSSLTLDSICSENLPTPEQLIRMELRARTLYEVATCQDLYAPNWDCLKSTDKLRFHWQAHAGVKLQETPFDNFRLCYLRNRRKNGPKMGVREIRTEMKLRWSNMDRSERMPFIVQALLYQVSVGAIDPKNQCAVREFFQKVK